MFLALVFYAAVGVLGYSNFCALTNGDILINYGSEVIPAQVARIAMMVSFVFTYPILCYPCRHALDSILFNHRPFTCVGRDAWAVTRGGLNAIIFCPPG